MISELFLILITSQYGTIVSPMYLKENKFEKINRVKIIMLTKKNKQAIIMLFSKENKERGLDYVQIDRKS